MRTYPTANHKNERSSRNAEAGFTLMEVLIAISILAVGLLAIASMQIAAIQTTGGAKSISTGIMWAEDRMEFLSSLPFANAALNVGNNQPDPLASPPGYTITYDVANVFGVANSRQITINVQWTERGINKSTTLTGVKPQLD